jgi:hypothetical protein
MGGDDRFFIESSYPHAEGFGLHLCRKPRRSGTAPSPKATSVNKDTLEINAAEFYSILNKKWTEEGLDQSRGAGTQSLEAGTHTDPFQKNASGIGRNYAEERRGFSFVGNLLPSFPYFCELRRLNQLHYRVHFLLILLK